MNNLNLITKQIPSIVPWIGKKYSNSNIKLLILGDYHFVPIESEDYLNPDYWYDMAGNDISDQELDRILTSRIIDQAVKNNFSSNSHLLYKNIALALNELLKLDDNREALNYISFYNFFRRPAKIGESLNICNDDISVAKEYLNKFISHYSPDIIIFTSQLVGEHAEEIISSKGLSYYNHRDASSDWWGKPVNKNDRNSGRELFLEFLKIAKWGE